MWAKRRFRIPDKFSGVAVKVNRLQSCPKATPNLLTILMPGLKAVEQPRLQKGVNSDDAGYEVQQHQEVVFT